METSLRIVLLLVAVLIIVGIVWDTFRSRRKKIGPRKKTSTVRLFNKSDRFLEEDLNEGDEENNRDGESVSASIVSHNANNSGSKKNPKVSIKQQGQDRRSEEEEIILVKPSKSYPQSSSKGFSKSNVYQQSKASKYPETEEPEIIEQENDFSEIIVLNVLAKRPNLFTGKRLLEAFNETHLYYGENQFFNRYEHSDGTGKPLFSVISAIEPGYFELSQIENIKTPGLTLFFRSGTRNQSVTSFELMLRTSKILAQLLGGDVMDQKRNILTSNQVEKYREKIRDISSSLGINH